MEQARLLRTLLTLQETHPEVTIVVAHDAEQWTDLLETGALSAL